MQLSLNDYAPDTVLPAHRHGRPTLSIVFRGRQLERDPGGERLLGPLSLALKPGGLEHENVVLAAPLRALFVELPGSDVPAGPLCYGAESGTPEVTVHVARLCWAASTGSTRVGEAVEALILAVRACELLEGLPPWLRHARETVLAGACGSWALGEIARRSGVHPVHLARSFRNHTACTVGELVRVARTARALRGLATADTSLAAVATESGFADQSHMTRVFRRLVGATPAAFRRALRSDAPPCPPTPRRRAC